MDVMPQMDAGLRLILSCVQWICLDPKLDDVENDRQIVQNLNETLHSELSDDSRLANYDIVFSEEETIDYVTSKSKHLRRSKSLHNVGFWARNFGDSKKKVELTKVLECIKADYTYDYSRLQFQDSWACKALAFWCFDLERNA